MCGVLVVREIGRPFIFHITGNIAEPDNEYIVDPEDHMRLVEEGKEIVGVVHSHVKADATPSGMDVEMMVPGYLYAICSVRHNEMRAWRKTHMGDVIEVPIVVEKR